MISAISLCDSVAKIVFHYFFLIKSSDQQKRLNSEIAAEITKNGDLVFVMFATISNNYFIKCIASYQTAERTNDGSRYHRQSNSLLSIVLRTFKCRNIRSFSAFYSLPFSFALSYARSVRSVCSLILTLTH